MHFFWGEKQQLLTLASYAALGNQIHMFLGMRPIFMLAKNPNTPSIETTYDYLVDRSAVKQCQAWVQ